MNVLLLSLECTAVLCFKKKIFEGGGTAFRKKADAEAELIYDIPVRRAWFSKNLEHARPGYDSAKRLVKNTSVFDQH